LSSSIEPNARSNHEQALRMQIAGPGQGRIEASTDVAARPDRPPSSRPWPDRLPRQLRRDGEAGARRQRAADLRRRCKRAAKRIRSSTGMVAARRLDGAAEDWPWPRLLLWVFACAALVVSLIVRADGLDDRAPGSALRATATEGLPETGLPMLGWIIQRGEAAAWSVKSGPRG
jgi:hypothetical protein